MKVSIEAIEKRARRLLSKAGHRLSWSRSEERYHLIDDAGVHYGTAESPTALGRMLALLAEGEVIA